MPITRRRAGVTAVLAMIALASPPSSRAQSQEVVWRNAVGVSVTGSGLTKTAGTAWGNAGAISAQALELGGYVEWSTSEASTLQMIGLGSGDSSQSYTDIEYALYLNSGTLQVYEAGYPRASLGAYSAADRFRVEVAHGKARYLKNGVVLYSSNANPKYPLVVDTASYTVGATLTDVRIGRMAWRNDVGVSISGDTLTKTGTTGWNAGAVSTETIVSGDGYVEFTATETDKARICGLGKGDGGQAASDVDFGLQLNADATVGVYESGTSRGSFGAYATGDRFRVEVRGGVVRYLQNDTVIYTSLLSPEYPLVADTSLNEPGSSLTDVVVSKLIWQDAVGVSVSGATLTNTGPAGWIAGAVSTQAIEAGSGYVEFTAVETTTSRACGLGTADADQSPGDIDFAISLTSAGAVEVRESGVLRGSFGTYVPGDRFRVEVYAGVVRYRKNGAVFYTSTLLPVYPLAVDTSLNETGATIADVQSGSTVWTGELGVTVWGSGLLSTASGWGNAGAISTTSLPSGDGWVEVTAQDTVTQQMFGLGFGDASRSYTDIEYGLFLSNGTLQVYESGAYRGSFGGYAAGDRLRVEVAGGTVRYAKNGATVYTSAVPPQYPLVVDTAAYTANALLGEVVISGFAELTKVPTPTLSPAPGAYSPPQSVSLSCALPTAQIRYTTNGAEPDAASTLYTGPIPLASTTTLKAKAFRPTLADSDTATGAYELRVLAPSFSAGTGTYSDVVNVTMTSGTSGAEIRYTTDGSEPVTSSTLYTAPVGISLPVTLKAKAFKLGLASTTTTATYSFRVASPWLSPGTGTYFGDQTVTVSCSSPAAVIHLTTNGLDPTEADPVVASGGTIPIHATATVKARAWRSGWEPSWLTSATYTMAVAPPVLAPGSGSYSGSVPVTVTTTTPSATLHYTTTSRPPTPADPTVASGGTLLVDRSRTLTVIGRRPGWSDSATVWGTYHLTAGTAASPEFSPPPGVYTQPIEVRVSTATPAAIIRYTLDGSEPKFDSPVYLGPLALDADATLRARAYGPDLVPSPITTGCYTVGSLDTVTAPRFAPVPARYATRQSVALASTTPGATVRYTTNGAPPGPADPVAGSGVLVDRSMVVKARAWKDGLAPSGTRSGFYLVTGSLASGANHALALSEDRTVWAWGQNSHGELGNGTTANSTTPIAVLGLTDVVAVATGEYHSLALDSAGRVWAWGGNSYGQLGDGTTANSLTPKLVSGVADVVAIAAGRRHNLAATSSGGVWAWGDNYWGQLGDGTQTSRLSPVPIAGISEVTALAGEYSHSLALTADGRVWSWGSNYYGALGDGTNQSRLTPGVVPWLSGVARIGAGNGYSVALKTDGRSAGSVWTWGSAWNGRLGYPASFGVNRPSLVLEGVMAIAVGWGHALALRQDGQVLAWGEGSSGQIGDGARQTRVRPVPVGGLQDAIALSAGDNDSVAIHADGGVSRWGSWANSSTPVPVPGLSLVPNAWLAQDHDDDGLNAWGEWRYECDPYLADTNTDGVRDDIAVVLGLSCGGLDTDGDGLLNTEEASAGTSLTSADTDGDGVGDATDCAPLDPTRSSCPNDPGDHTPPTITLLEPPNAILLP